VRAPNAYVLDPILPYVRRFHALGFGILDVNIPAHDPATSASTNDPLFVARPSAVHLEAATKELLCYLWDNYLEGYASENIVLMGVGDAYLGVKMLLTSRGAFPSSPSRPGPTLTYI
jgi:histone deacetylase 6